MTMLGMLSAASVTSLLLTSLATAQVETAWVKRYNGAGNGSDRARALALDDLGNIYVAGSCTANNGRYDYSIIKYYPNGDTAWTRTYDGPANGDDIVSDLAVDQSSCVYVTGSSFDSTTGKDFLTIKYSSNGDLAWSRRFGMTDDEASKIVVDDSGDVYVTGLSSGMNVTIKYSRNGDTAWMREYAFVEGFAFPYVSGLDADHAGNVYVSGGSITPTLPFNPPGFNSRVLVYSPSGDTIWSRRWGWASASYALDVDNDGNVYIAGDWLITQKYSAVGDSLWSDIYSTTVECSNCEGNCWGPFYGANALSADRNGDVLVTGYGLQADTCFSKTDYITRKYSSSGSLLWERRHDAGNTSDYANAVTIDNLGDVYVTGSSDGDYETIKYSADGDSVWMVRYDGTGNGPDVARSIAVDDSGNIYVTGYSNGSGTGEDMVTIKYRQTALTGVKNEGGRPSPERFFLEQNYPNPFNPSTVIRYSVPFSSRVSVKIYNFLGQEIATLLDDTQNAGYHEITWSAVDQFGSGVYYCRLRSGIFTHGIKLLLVK